MRPFDRLERSPGPLFECGRDFVARRLQAKVGFQRRGSDPLAQPLGISDQLIENGSLRVGDERIEIGCALAQ